MPLAYLRRTAVRSRKSAQPELVPGLFPVGRLSPTHVQAIRYAGFGHSLSKHVEFHFDDPVAEVLASQSKLGHAPRGITRQVRRRLYSQLGGRLPESPSPIKSRTGSASRRQAAVAGGIAHQGCPAWPAFQPITAPSTVPRNVWRSSNQGGPLLVARTDGEDILRLSQDHRQLDEAVRRGRSFGVSPASRSGQQIPGLCTLRRQTAPDVVPQLWEEEAIRGAGASGSALGTTTIGRIRRERPPLSQKNPKP